MIKLINLDKEKYSEDKYKIKTLFKFFNWALQIVKKRKHN